MDKSQKKFSSISGKEGINCENAMLIADCDIKRLGII